MLVVLLLVLHLSVDLLQFSYACFSVSVELASQWLQHLLDKMAIPFGDGVIVSAELGISVAYSNGVMML